MSITGLGIGGAVIGHVGTATWTLTHTSILIGGMILLTVIAKCISFAYTLYERGGPKLQALRFVKGDGLNSGNTILVFSYADGFCKGQLLTLFCSSSGAKQPILVAEITAVYPGEVQAVPVSPIADHEIRKYFEEESRRKMLFATPEIFSDSIVAQGLGAENDS